MKSYGCSESLLLFFAKLRHILEKRDLMGGNFVGKEKKVFVWRTITTNNYHITRDFSP